MSVTVRSAAACEEEPSWAGPRQTGPERGERIEVLGQAEQNPRVGRMERHGLGAPVTLVPHSTLSSNDNARRNGLD